MGNPLKTFPFNWLLVLMHGLGISAVCPLENLQDSRPWETVHCLDPSL